MTALNFNELASSPHIAIIRQIASMCWRNESIKAIWVGGSLASGTGDRYSDVDFRIAVEDGDLDEWREPDWEALIPIPVLGSSFLKFGEPAMLHHMIIGDGTIIDFHVQIKSHKYFEPAISLIGCRDSELKTAIESFQQPASSVTQDVNASAVQQFLVDYWITTHKELKAVARNYSLFTFVGLYHERLSLLRAWHIQHNGLDIDGRYTIHLLAYMQKSLQNVITLEQANLLGMPTSTIQETAAAVVAVRNEISLVGRRLADQYGFAYPADLEFVVRKVWSEELISLKLDL